MLIFTGIATQAQHQKQLCIYPIESGGMSYLIVKQDCCILVDAGSHGSMKKIDKAIMRAGISYRDIKYIVVTHTHYDHVVNLAVLKQLTGALVIMHESEKMHIESGLTPLPDGMTAAGKFGLWITRNFRKHKTIVEPVAPDILVQNNYKIGNTGFEIKHTPGHSDGSISLILNDTICFCGDAAFRVFRNDLMPITGKSKIEMLQTWDELLAYGCRYFYPGHGKPFTCAELLQSIEKHRTSAK